MEVCCFNCTEKIQGNSSFTFLGFKKYKCNSCGSNNIYPLNEGFRFFLWFYFFFFILGIYISITDNTVRLIPTPLIIFFIITLYGLYKDFRIRKKIRINQKGK